MKKHKPDMIGPWAKENGLDHIAKLYDPHWKPKKKLLKRDISIKKSKEKHR